MERNFALGAVLTVAGDKLMCDIGKVYEVLNYMTGDNLFTHQLPRAAKECRPILIKKHPWLTEYIETVQPKVTPENVREVIAECEAWWGSEVAVDELSAAGDHDFKEPLQELCEMVGPDRVIAIEGLGGQE
jgi:hypothetical protein